MTDNAKTFITYRPNNPSAQGCYCRAEHVDVRLFHTVGPSNAKRRQES